MTARLASLSPRAQVALVAGVLLLVAVIGYFAVIAPKRSTAADLKKQTAAVQAQIDQNRSIGVHEGAAGRARRDRLQPHAGDAEPARHSGCDPAAEPARGGLWHHVRPDPARRRERATTRRGHDGPVRRRADPGPVHRQLLQPPRLPPAAAQPRTGRERTPLHRGTALRRERRHVRRGRRRAGRRSRRRSTVIDVRAQAASNAGPRRTTATGHHRHDVDDHDRPTTTTSNPTSAAPSTSGGTS